jgi:hypothetical protein
MAILDNASGGSESAAPAASAGGEPGSGSVMGEPVSGGFLDSLPEDIRGETSLANFKDVGSLAKSYVETKRMIGDPAVLKPPKDPGQKAEWIKATRPKLVELGLMEAPPADAKGYEFVFEGVSPEAIAADPGINAFREAALEAGLSNKQASLLVAKYREKIFPAMAPKMPTEDEARAELSKPEAFGSKFAEKVDSARKAVNALNAHVPGFKDWLEDGSRGFLGNDPMYIRIMAAVGEMIGQDSSAGLGERQTGETLESIDDRIRSVRNDATLTSEQQGSKLIPLYKIKQDLLNKQKVKR